MSKETGGQAFPWVESHTSAIDGERVENHGDAGMTLRDYFAAKAMQSLVSSGLNTGAWDDYEDLSASAYRIADDMLRARGQ